MTTNNIPPRWYVVDRTGRAITCQDKDDAEKEAAGREVCWPDIGPHIAVQLAPVQSAMPADAVITEQAREIASLKHEINMLQFKLRGVDMRPQVPIARRRIEGESNG